MEGEAVGVRVGARTDRREGARTERREDARTKRREGVREKYDAIEVHRWAGFFVGKPGWLSTEPQTVRSSPERPWLVIMGFFSRYLILVKQT